jgi:hypothetical protein
MDDQTTLPAERFHLLPSGLAVLGATRRFGRTFIVSWTLGSVFHRMEDMGCAAFDRQRTGARLQRRLQTLQHAGPG